MATLLSKFGQWTEAGWSIVTTGKFRPNNDGSTSFVQLVTPVDFSGNVIESTQTLEVTSTPTVTSGSAYTSGYSFGGVQSFTVPNDGIIQTAGVALSSGTFSGSFDFLVFSAQPTGTYADNTAVTVTAGDAALLIAVIHLTDQTSLGGALTYTQAQNVALPFNFAGTTLYVLPIIRGTPTLGSTSAATIALEILK